jgi:hypothetical protein
VEFVGGPLDGLVLSDSEFRAHHELKMPTLAKEQNHESAPDDIRRDWLTAYRFTGEPAATENDSSSPRVPYVFLGHDRAAGEIERQAARPRPSPRVISIRRWLCKLGHRVRDWMLEPVDYPLKVLVPIDRRPNSPGSLGLHSRYVAEISHL